MKVVLFCGGLGTRLREYSETIPKPLVTIGSRPIIWHLMKYYAHYGHNDFVLCLGYRGELIKEYFLNYNECMSNDFSLSEGGKKVQLFHSDIQDWKITFVDTGQRSNIGQRLKAVQKHLEGEEMFLANYSDGLSDLPLDGFINDVRNSSAIAGFVGVRPSQSFHSITVGNGELVQSINPIGTSTVWINGGFFVFKQDIFRFIQNGEELVEQPFERLITEQRLMSRLHDGFWASMDTFKDKKMFDDLYDSGKRPWEVWNQHR
jgi:glucose-1-phosphate cytidylyltransferase